jgi:hypothetical protein
LNLVMRAHAIKFVDSVRAYVAFGTPR